MGVYWVGRYGTGVWGRVFRMGFADLCGECWGVGGDGPVACCGRA